ncbi:MAG: hypothetical protein J0I29_01460 [Rhizobiales bacterium]|nr:hypothetical protein [Hyphomicrobiales bacterium]
MSDLPNWLSLISPKFDDFLKNSKDWVTDFRNLLHALLALQVAMLLVLIYIAWRLS